MTDDELRKLAEAAIAGERFMTDDDGRRVSLREIMGEPPDTAPELARAVLRLLEDVQILRERLGHVAVDAKIEALMRRATDLLAESNAATKAERDELARYKAAVEAELDDAGGCPNACIGYLCRAIGNRLEKP